MENEILRKGSDSLVSKKIVILFSILLMLTWGLIGCSDQKVESSVNNSNGKLSSSTKGFQLISAQVPLPDEVSEWIESAKKTAGVHKMTSDGVQYVLLSVGEKPNAGYQLEVVEIVETPDYSKVIVRVKEPDPNKFYPQVISYPYLLGTSEKEVQMEILEK